MADKIRALVTGAAGQIGTIIRNKLGYRYELTGLDVVDHDYPTSHVADLSDLEAISPAFEGQEVVIHLGADPSPSAPWDSILQNNIIATRNVYEAARLAGVKRVIFASTNHVVGYYPMKQEPYKAIYDGRLSEVRRPFRLLDHTDIRPDSYYGVSKAFGESLGSYFRDAFGLSVICIRIGWVMTPDDPTFHPSALSLWLSHRDAAQAIQRSIDAPESEGYAIVHGMSKNALRIWDIETANDLIGFDPEDGAGEDWTLREGRNGASPQRKIPTLRRTPHITESTEFRLTQAGKHALDVR